MEDITHEDLQKFFLCPSYQKMLHELEVELSLNIMPVPEVIYPIDVLRVNKSGMNIKYLVHSLDVDYVFVKAFSEVKMKKTVEDAIASGGKVEGTLSNFILANLIEFNLIKSNNMEKLKEYIDALRVPNASRYKKNLTEYYRDSVKN